MRFLSDMARRLRASAADDLQVRDQVTVDNLRRLRLGALLALPVFLGASGWMLQGWLTGGGMAPW